MFAWFSLVQVERTVTHSSSKVPPTRVPIKAMTILQRILVMVPDLVGWVDQDPTRVDTLAHEVPQWDHGVQWVCEDPCVHLVGLWAHDLE